MIAGFGMRKTLKERQMAHSTRKQWTMLIIFAIVALALSAALVSLVFTDPAAADMIAKGASQWQK